MFSENDSDIKIFGKEKEKAVSFDCLSEEKIASAKQIGKKVAQIYINDVTKQQSVPNENSELLYQRKLLLSFTATIGFEQNIGSDSLSGIAQKSFLDTLKATDTELFNSSCDTGAFSFYYLAYRKEFDIERRIGQTFAMLCSHDGDPIFQELGEALFCWFSSEVKKIVSENL